MCWFIYFMFLYHLVELKIEPSNIEFKHGFSCINVCQVPREMLETEGEARGLGTWQTLMYRKIMFLIAIIA